MFCACTLVEREKARCIPEMMIKGNQRSSYSILFKDKSKFKYIYTYELSEASNIQN